MGGILKCLQTRRVVGHLLGGRQEEHWWNLAGRTPVLGVFGDADDLEGSGIFLIQVSEVFSDRVLILEKLLGKCLVNYRDDPRARGVLSEMPRPLTILVPTASK